MARDSGAGYKRLIKIMNDKFDEISTNLEAAFVPTNTYENDQEEQDTTLTDHEERLEWLEEIANKTPDEPVLPQPEKKIFGVLWNFSVSTPKWSRLTPDNDPNSFVNARVEQDPTIATSASTSGSSVFNDIEPWKSLPRKRNITGTFLDSWDDEVGFTLTDKDVMQLLPDLWYKIIKDTTNKRLYIYGTGVEPDNNSVLGFKKHPASMTYLSSNFMDTEGNAHSGGSGYFSYFNNVRPALTNANKGDGWAAMDLMQLEYLLILMLLEFGTFDLMDYFGITDVPATRGVTDSMTYHTGRISATGGMKYRGFENLFGGSYDSSHTFIDGIMMLGYQLYICADPDKYQKTSMSTSSGTPVPDGYTAYGPLYTSGNYYGYIKELYYDEDVPWLFSMPSVLTGGSSTTFVADQAYMQSYNTNYPSPVKMGYGTSMSGPFALFGHVHPVGSSPDYDPYAGLRLSFRPQAE